MGGRGRLMGRGGDAGGWVTAGQVGVAASERDRGVIARRGGKQRRQG